MTLTLDACSIILSEIRELSKKIDALTDRVPASRKRKEQGDAAAQICNGKTAKGQPCNHRALPGSEFCKMHDPKKKKASSSSPAQRLVKVEPEHTHGPSEEPNGTCGLCETHGDPVNDHLTEDDDVKEEEDEDDEYIVDAQANERLRQLLLEQDL